MVKSEDLQITCFASMEKIGQVNGRDLFGGVQ